MRELLPRILCSHVPLDSSVLWQILNCCLFPWHWVQYSICRVLTHHNRTAKFIKCSDVSALKTYLLLFIFVVYWMSVFFLFKEKAGFYVQMVEKQCFWILDLMLVKCCHVIFSFLLSVLWTGWPGTCAMTEMQYLNVFWLAVQTWITDRQTVDSSWTQIWDVLLSDNGVKNASSRSGDSLGHCFLIFIFSV